MAGSILTTVPSASAHSWTTEYATAIDSVSDILLQYTKVTMPTTRIMLRYAKTYELGPDGKINYNFLTEMYDVHAMKQNQVFAFEDIDPVSRMEWTTKQWWAGAGISDFQTVRYGRTNRSMVDLAAEKVQAIHAGLTWFFNYNLWSNWSETITAGQIDIQSALSGSTFVRPPIKYKDMVDYSDRPYSIPMIIRKNVTGHTIGNVSSANEHWESIISDMSGATVTRNTTSGDARADVVTSDHTVTVTMDYDDVEDHLGKMQQGANYNLLAACPRSLYKVLKDYLLAERRRDVSQNNLDAELGITANLTWEDYGCTFYVEPVLDTLFPNTIWFFDPECMFFCFDPAFNPKVVPWQEIPGTNQSGTVVYFDGQLVCTDRRGTGAIHGGSAA